MSVMMAVAVEVPDLGEDRRDEVVNALGALAGVTRVETLVWDTTQFEFADLRIGIRESDDRVGFLMAMGRMR